MIWLYMDRIGGGHFNFECSACASVPLQNGGNWLVYTHHNRQLSGPNGFLPGLRKRNLGIGAECHVDSVLGYWMPIVEISLHRAIDPDSQLEPVAIGEDVILVFRVDRLELAVGEADALSAHEKYSMTPFGIPRISAG